MERRQEGRQAGWGPRELHGRESHGRCFHCTYPRPGAEEASSTGGAVGTDTSPRQSLCPSRRRRKGVAWQGRTLQATTTHPAKPRRETGPQPARLIPTLPGCDEVPQPPRAGVRGQEESRDFERWQLVTGPLVSAEPRLAWGHRAWRGQQLGTHALLSQRKPHGVPEPPPSGGVEPPPPWV